LVSNFLGRFHGVVAAKLCAAGKMQKKGSRRRRSGFGGLEKGESYENLRGCVPQMKEITKKGAETRKTHKKINYLLQSQ
jgi:hypothetical protein